MQYYELAQLMGADQDLNGNGTLDLVWQEGEEETLAFEIDFIETLQEHHL